MREPTLPHLEELVRRASPGEHPFEPVAMPGGASPRRFFRVSLGPGRGTAVGVFVPDATRPDEIHKHDGVERRWPFLEVRDLLASRGVRVPAILGEATEHGWLLVEDLGDDTIANYLLRRPEQKVAVYQIAVRDLADAQRALATLPEGSVVAGRAFDEDLLHWEIDHFREWALDARGLSLAPAERATFDAIAGRLARRVAALPRGFTHRDYQSRNLMVTTGAADEPTGLVWIDFQDALLGPRAYDLVALLSDSYQTFERSFVDERLDEFAARAGLDARGREDLGRELDVVTVQRKLKDAGRFVFIDREKGNPSFLPFVDPTIAKARAAMSRLAAADDDMRVLGELVDRVLARTP